MNEEELKSLWQSQPIMTVSYSLEQLQQDAVGFRRKIVRVYVQESIAALIVALIFGYFAWVSPVLPMRIGGGLVVVGSFFMLFQLRKHQALIRALPQESLGLPYLAYFREELVRQRDVLRNVWSWLIPSMTGMSVLFWGMAQPNPADFPWSMTALLIIPYIVGIGLQFLAAHKIQRKIDQLDQLNESEKN